MASKKEIRPDVAKISKAQLEEIKEPRLGNGLWPPCWEAVLWLVICVWCHMSSMLAGFPLKTCSALAVCYIFKVLNTLFPLGWCFYPTMYYSWAEHMRVKSLFHYWLKLQMTTHSLSWYLITKHMMMSCLLNTNCFNQISGVTLKYEDTQTLHLDTVSNYDSVSIGYWWKCQSACSLQYSEAYNQIIVQ